MSRQNSIKEFIELQDVIVNKIEKNEKEIEIYLEMEVKEHECPCCHKKTKKIHDYRIQRITDAPYLLKSVILVLRKRRYVCPHCGKRFYEKNEFLPRYHRMTSRLSAYVQTVQGIKRGLVQRRYNNCRQISLDKTGYMGI